MCTGLTRAVDAAGQHSRRSHSLPVGLVAERRPLHRDHHSPQLRPSPPGAAPAPSEREAALAAPCGLSEERCHCACADPKAPGRHHGGRVSPVPRRTSTPYCQIVISSPLTWLLLFLCIMPSFHARMSLLLWLFRPACLLVLIIRVTAATNSSKQSSTVYLTGAILSVNLASSSSGYIQ